MNLDEFKLKALAAIREIGMAVEFAEQAHEAMEDGAFRAASDSELISAENAVITARLTLDELSELLQAATKAATEAAKEGA